MYTGRSCWLCGRNGTAEPLDKHHIFGGAYRKKSEKHGLTVYLCHSSCHIFGTKAVHSCRETMDELHRYGQKLAMEQMGRKVGDIADAVGLHEPSVYRELNRGITDKLDANGRFEYDIDKAQMDAARARANKGKFKGVGVDGRCKRHAAEN